MTYKEALDFLYSQLPMFQRIGPAAFKKDLTRTRALCEQLGHPERKFRSVHIAGTNGKGSVSNMLAAVCTAAGLKTGLYTSPHYKDFRERIRIDGALMPKRAVSRFVEAMQPLCATLEPSFFELTVAMAFDYFARQEVDVAIIETGLGGRLDSTNVVTPLLSIITNIDYDHQQFLGDTLPEIAAEKAGIIKLGIPVIIGQSQPETDAVFEKKARETGSPIQFADRRFQVAPLRQNDSHVFYEVKENGKVLFKEMALNQLGPYQQFNLPTLLAAFYSLRKTLNLEERNLTEGLKNLKALTGFQGRWEFISRRPRILIDSAHNQAGVNLMVQNLQSQKFERLFIVLGVVQDKELDKVLPLFPKNARYFFAKANIPRGLDAEILQEKAAAFGLKGKAYSSVRRALAAAKRKANPSDDLILVGGSIFTVAEVV
jgi:dihydrofolate synthase/folylpolyglutamate synthase